MALFINWLAQDKSRINELTKVKQAADESERLTSAFLANISHEMRMPLNGILGLAQMMLKLEDLSPNIRKGVKMIVDSGNSMLAVVDDIMDMSKIETGQIKIRREPLFLNTLMDMLHYISTENPHFLRKNAGQQNIELKCDSRGENIAIMADSVRLKQIMLKLIDNALKFTQKGRVNFGYTIRDKEIVFYVKDTGIGIPEDKTEMIFEKFVQVDDTSVRKSGGTGLGLSLSKGFATMMNGKIWCESDLGKGSCFYFSIPYHPATMPANTGTPQKNGGVIYDWSEYTVLIVEDDIVSYKVLGSMLRNTKVNVIHADNGLTAIEQTRLNPQIDLVLMDVHLPEMNGLEAAGKILDINPSLPVIAQTTDAMIDDRDKCLKTGCADYISKPINMSELLTKMSKFLPGK